MLSRFAKRCQSTLNNNFVKIVEVSPRDGLQNEKAMVSTAQKLQLINMLVASGLKVIEAGSFVSPKWVPQMADTPEIYSKLSNVGSISYPALVPNLKGLDGAIKAGVKEIAIFGAASEMFSQKNINCSIEESLDRFSKVSKVALENGLKVRGYVSTVVGCPYQGEVPVEKVVQVAKAMYDLGCYEISLGKLLLIPGDTIGVGTPGKVSQMLDAVIDFIPKEKLAIHFHDTYGQAIGNIVVGLQKGIRVIDSSVAGLVINHF
jgi:hydroxymethylglutaryl-CoA lyase